MFELRRFCLGAWGARKFLVFQHSVVPRSRGFSWSQTQESLRLVHQLLGEKPYSIRIKILVFLALIDLISVFVGRKSFAGLSEAKQQRVLQCLFNSPVPLIRKGFWGLSTLAKLGVYGQSDIYPSIRYQLRQVPTSGSLS